MLEIQRKLQDIVKLAKETNIQIAKIKNTILQASDDYWEQTAGDIFCMSEDLWNIIQSDIENKVYHIQKLLVDELDKCKGKENNYMEEHIKEIQETYKEEDIIMKDQDTKGKQ